MHDQRWDHSQRPGGHRDLLVLDPEPDRQLTLEHVEEVGVAVVDVEAGALAAGAEARPGRVQLVAVGEDLDPAVGGVADDLALAGWDYDRLAHTATLALSPGCPRTAAP